MGHVRESRWGALPAVLTVGAVAIAQLWPGLRRGLAPPVSWDHAAHLVKAVLTERELLPALRGWTDMIELGVPLHTLYSIGGTLWLLLFRSMTFGALEWEQTYALAFAAFRVVVGLAMYRLARASGAGRIPSCLAAVVALADRGDHSEGGWFYDVQFGVWPMQLGVSLFFLALAELPRLAAEGGRARALRASLLLGAALVTHQMCFIATCTLLPLFVASRWLDREGRLTRTTMTIGAVGVAGLLLSAFWLVPMIARSGWVADQGQLYHTTAEIGRRAAAGELILRGGPWTGVLGATALLLGLASRGTRRFYALGAAALTLASTRSLLETLHLLELFPSLGRIMYPRFMMLAKPLLFALGACVIEDLLRVALPRLRRELRTLRGIVALGAGTALLAPFMPSVAAAVHERVVQRHVPTTATLDGWQDYLEYAAWVRSLAGEPFFRIAYHHESSHLFQGAPIYTGRPAYQMDMLVAEVFGNVTESDHPDALRAMNVRFIVSPHELPKALAEDVAPVRDFGPWHVWELQDWTPELVYADSFHDGDAPHREPRSLSVERDRVVVDPGSARRVTLRRALAPGWRALADGHELPVGGAPVTHARGLRVMRAEVPPATKRLTFVYDRWLTSDVVGLVLTLFGAGGLAVLVLPVPALRRRTGAAWARLEPAMTRAALPALGAAVLGAAVLLVIRSSPAFDARRDLAKAHVHVRDASGAQHPCTASRPDGGLDCPTADWLFVGPVQQPVEGRIRSCLWAHPPPEGALYLRFPDVELSDTLELAGGVHDKVGGSGEPPFVDMRVRVDGTDRTTLRVPFGHVWVEEVLRVEPGPHDLELVIRAEEPHLRHFCFQARSP